MQATIYVTPEAFQTAMTINDLGYSERTNLCDEIPALADQPGYHFKNADKLKLAVLPPDARVALVVAEAGVKSDRSVEFGITLPANLRGCIFEMAPNLPPGYAEIVAYWSGETMNTNSSGAAYFQCSLNEYMVDLGPDPVNAPVINDRLLSEGVVVAILGLEALLSRLSPEDFIEVQVPIDPDMLGIEPDSFLSTAEYDASTARRDQVFLKVADILASPDRDRVFIDLLCHELLDYGYWY